MEEPFTPIAESAKNNNLKILQDTSFLGRAHMMFALQLYKTQLEHMNIECYTV